MTARTKEPSAFKPHWPEGVQQNTLYEVLCDDKGRNGTVWMRVLVANDGDVHVSMFDQEDPARDEPSQFPSIRVRTVAGGGRNARTRQALLWLADAIRRDNEENRRRT